LNRLPRWLVAVLVGVPAAALALLFVWPMVTLVARVVRPGSFDVLTRSTVLDTLWFSTWLAVLSTVLTMLVGLPVAGLLARYRFAGRRVTLAAATVPFVLPTVVVGAAFGALLPASWDATVRAVLLAHVYFNVAVVVRVVGGAWATVPHDLVAAAATLGASPRRTFAAITWPLLRPAVGAAAGVVFVFTFTSYGVVRVLGSPAHPTLEVEIARRATQLGDVGGAAVLALVQMVVLAVVVGVSTRAGRRGWALRGSAGPRPPRRRHRLAVMGAATAVVVAVAVPLAALVVASLRPGGTWGLSGWRALVRPVADRPGAGIAVDPLAALGVSLRAALVAAVLATAIGAMAVLAIGATRRTGRVLDGALMLPLVTSAVTVGLGLVITFDVGPFDWRARWWFVPLGQALVAVPFVVRALLPVLRAVPADLRAAANTLGASPMRAWWWVDVGILRRPLLAAAAFAGAISLGEFGATSVLSRSGTDTATTAIVTLLGRTGDVPRAQGFALATMLLVLVAALVACADPASAAAITDEDRRAVGS
jgi:thiamine transport system permease protein